MTGARALLLFTLACLAAQSAPQAAAQSAAQRGLALIEASLQRHALPPYVYEDETLVVTNRSGQHTLRTLRHYARRDAGSVESVRVIETPFELRGIEVGVAREARGGRRRGTDPSSQLFGSDFTVGDLEDEQPGDYDYLSLIHI